jgi:hypothetical protein
MKLYDTYASLTRSTKTTVSAGSPVLAAALVLAFGMQVGAASAQSVRSAQDQSRDMFARDRAVSVLQRPRPEYDALGVPFGPFIAFPKLQVEAEHNDNVFAVENGAVSDQSFRVKPEINLSSDWNRHYLRAYLRDTLSRNDKYTTENLHDWGLGASGRLDVTRELNITAGADYADSTEPRTASNTALSSRDPITYTYSQAYLAGSRSVGRTRLSTRFDYNNYNYRDGRTLTGLVVEQDDRDHDTAILTGRADYAVSPATAVFAQVAGNKRNYDTVPGVLTPPRDSDGYEALVGVNFELGAVVRGEFAAGYVRQSFDNPAYKTIKGFGSRTQVEWFPTELTTVSGSFARTVQDAGVPGAGGYLSSAFGLGVDHELLRNLILTARADYSHDKYNGIDRTDNRLNTLLRASYLMNRRVGVSVTYSHLNQDSKGSSLATGPSYDVNRFYVSLTTQF